MRGGFGLLCAILLLSSCAKPKSNTPHTAPLVRAPDDPPGSAVLIGTYFEAGDSALFTHCATRAQYPLAREGALDALRRSVAHAPHDPTQPIVVSLVGRLQPLPVREGVPPRDQLIVDRLLRVWPDEICDKVGVDTSLDNTYWKLVELNGAPVATHEGQHEVHVILRAHDRSVGGFGGCSQLSGRWEREGTRLRFTGLGSTPTPCPHSDEEAAFTKALDTVTEYQILGESLDLRSGTESVARLRAVYLR